MKKEFIKMIENMTDEAFIRVLDECGCPKNYGLDGYGELCEHKSDASCFDCWRDALNCKETKNTLKTWEMIKELTENPEKKFKNKTNKVIAVLPDADLYFPDEDYNYLSIDDEWVEVKQPVTWQEALEAWVNGFEVQCEFDGEISIYKCIYYLKDNDSFALCNKEILEGKWHILDKEETSEGEWYINE